MRKLLVRLRGYGRGLPARQAARLQLPAWLKLLMLLTTLACVFALSFAIGLGADTLHRLVHPDVRAFAAASRAAQFLMIAPAFVAALAPGVIAAEIALWLVPAVRRVLDRNAEGVADAAFPGRSAA